MAVITYHSSDSGAPQVTNYSTGWMEAVMNILQGCLVNGYGAKPAAGWEMFHRGSNGIILHNPAAADSAYYNLYTTTTTATTTNGNTVLYVSKTVDTFSAGGQITSGDGLRSGAAGLQQRYVPRAAFGRNNSAWTVIADDQTFILYVSDASLDGQSGTFGKSMFIYCGSDSNGAQISMGGSFGATWSDPTTPYFDIGRAGGTILRDPSTQLLLDSAAGTYVSPFLPAVSPSGAFSNVRDWISEFVLEPVRWANSGRIPGFLRGVADNYALKCMNEQAVSLYLGGTGVVADRGKWFDFGGGVLMTHVYPGNSSPAVVLSNHPELWPIQ